MQQYISLSWVVRPCLFCLSVCFFYFLCFCFFFSFLFSFHIGIIVLLLLIVFSVLYYLEKNLIKHIDQKKRRSSKVKNEKNFQLLAFFFQHSSLALLVANYCDYDCFMFFVNCPIQYSISVHIRLLQFHSFLWGHCHFNANAPRTSKNNVCVHFASS